MNKKKWLAPVGVFTALLDYGCAAVRRNDSRPLAAEVVENAPEVLNNRAEIRLRALDGTRIHLAYRIIERSGSSDRRRLAAGVSVAVQNDSWAIVTPATARRIRFVLMSLCRPSNGGSEFEAYNQQTDVPFGMLSDGSGMGYEVQLDAAMPNDAEIPLGQTSIGGANTCRQEIAIVVDGVWLVDPVNGTHNFRFSM